MKKKACLIWNPMAGTHKKNEKNVNIIAEFLSQNDYELIRKATEGPATGDSQGNKREEGAEGGCAEAC